ncbi:MAG: class I SAM-dependent methyltransferase [Candidatus Hydrogenedentales bacterium]|jgi:2-polyprenyl-3-methyl-5-hydroxy-6-metoxy-1,4-benzoquinol methylase
MTANHHTDRDDARPDSAELWEAWNAEGGPKYPHEKVVQFCFRHFPPRSRAAVHALDLGCGGGVHTCFLAREGFRVTAVDASVTGVAHTIRRLKDEKIHATVGIRHIEAIEFPANSFGLVVCAGVLDAAGPDASREAVRRVSACMAPGARGIFLFASDRDFRVTGKNPYRLHGYTRREVESVFAAPLATVWIDTFITTYENGRVEQNDWIVTVER